MAEIWKNIKNYNNYEISNHGNAKYEGELMKQGTIRGLKYITLRDAKEVNSRHLIHRLVAEYFVPNDDPAKKVIIRHKNGNKIDNRFNNIEWITFHEHLKTDCDLEKKLQEKRDKNKKDMENDKIDDGEIWKDIVGYEGKYMASNFARFKSLSLNKMMTPTIHSGYCRLKLFDKENKPKVFEVQILIAKTFVPNDDPVKNVKVHHIDENPLNNRADNLKWVTSSQNTKEHHIKKGDRSGKVIQFDLNNNFIKDWPSINDAIKENPTFKRANIIGNINKRNHSAHGFIWKFSEEKKPVENKIHADEEFKQLGIIDEHDFILYKISNYGKLKNNDTGNYLKPAINNKGYYQVCIVDTLGNKINHTIHRLVALTFVPGHSKDKNFPNHIDENKLNNYYKNLEWITNQDNLIHSTGRKVNQLDLETGKIIKTFNSTSLAAEAFGKTNTSAIISCCRGRSKYAYGYKWEYADEVKFDEAKLLSMKKYLSDMKDKSKAIVERFNSVSAKFA